MPLKICFGNLKANKAIEHFQWELLEYQQDIIKDFD